MQMTTLTPELSKLEAFSALPSALALKKVIPVLECLVEDPAFRSSEILPLLEQADRAKEWYVAGTHTGDNRFFSLQIFVWPPGSETKVHDHASWGALRCVVGSLVEERYERLDYGLQPNRARLRKVWRMVWSRQDRASTVLPYEGGIHRVGNPGPGTAVSVHLYGRRVGELDGRDYDPSRDYVCDRAVV